MGTLVVTEYVSLDGVMEAPGGGEDFVHGGWTFRVERLFGDTVDAKPFRLTSSTTVGEGIAVLTYGRVDAAG
jgi:hypothetical protein